MAQRAKTPLLWIGKNPIYQLCGAEGEGAGQGGAGGDGQNNSNQQQGGNGSQSGSGDGSQGNGQSSTPAVVSKAEYDALMARMQAADKNKAAAETRVAELEGKDKSELEKAQQALAEANKKIETLTTGQRDMITSNAFLTVKDAPTWHNAGAALALLDKSLITISDDGKITGMEAAVTKLKSEHPYLVKSADAGAGDKKDDGKQQNGGKPSGSANNGAGGGGKQLDRSAMEKRFPAMRGRAATGS